MNFGRLVPFIVSRVKQLAIDRHSVAFKTNWTKMDLTLDFNVRGMTELDKTKFAKEVTVPSVAVPNEYVGVSMKVFKKYLLKLVKVKPVEDLDGKRRRVLLDPLLFDSFDKLDESEKSMLTKFDVQAENFTNTKIVLNYDNYKMEDVLKAILPEGKEGCTSFSRIGHILHLNLKDHLLPYKHLIGQVLMDKLVGVSTVVNKSHAIDSTYRNFKMEVLAGEADFVAEVKENMCTFKFDFSQVYWNSRLCTEHERIIKLLPEKAVLFDVFAGVGPFAVPAAKVRRCRVFANDLNPFSFHWLKENVRINKVANVETFNLDGRQFIREQLRPFLLEQPTDSIHVTMNLPAMAVEFLDAFIGLLDGMDSQSPYIPDLTVHVYSFCQDSSGTSEMRAKVESHLKQELLDEQIVQVLDVRDVAPKKHIIRLSFKMPLTVLLATTKSQVHQHQAQQEESESKRIKLDSDSSS